MNLWCCYWWSSFFKLLSVCERCLQNIKQIYNCSWTPPPLADFKAPLYFRWIPQGALIWWVRSHLLTSLTHANARADLRRKLNHVHHWYFCRRLKFLWVQGDMITNNHYRARWIVEWYTQKVRKNFKDKENKYRAIWNAYLKKKLLDSLRN